jgi:hypothetical protein
MAENHSPTRPPITRKPHRCQDDEDLVARFICHVNSTPVLQSSWRGLHGGTLIRLRKQVRSNLLGIYFERLRKLNDGAFLL